MEPNNERISSKVFAAVIATGLMSFSGVLVETSMNIAFPTLMRDFNVSTNVVQWMTSIYLLAVSIIVPISAALKSSYKTKSLFLTANFFPSKSFPAFIVVFAEFTTATIPVS